MFGVYGFRSLGLVRSAVFGVVWVLFSTCGVRVGVAVLCDRARFSGLRRGSRR